jgi:hypothetical protein
MTALITDVCDRCGNLRSVCSDPAVVAYPQRSVCYLTAAVEQMYRRTNRVFKHADPDDPTPHEADGLQWAASLYDLTPEDDFFGDAALLAAGRREETVGDHPQADHSE